MTRCAWLLPLAVTLGLLAPASGDDPKSDAKKKALADLLGKLKEKRDRQQNQVYKMEFETTGFGKGITGNCRERWELQIDWKTGKFRQVGWNACAATPFEIIRVYDGEKIKTQFRDVTNEGKPTGDGSWKYGMVTGRLNSDMFNRTPYWAPFLHKGVIPSHDDVFYPGHFVFDPDPEKFFIQGEVTRDGRKCISLKTFPENPMSPMQYEYFIDPGKDYAVVGFVYTMKEKASLTLDIKVVPAKQGGWVLGEWTYTSWNPDANPIATTKVKVSHFAEGVPVGENNSYDLVPPEGAKVRRSHYELPNGKQDQQIDFYQYEVKDGKLVQISGPTEPLYWVRRNWRWLGLVAAGVVAALVTRRGWRGRREKPDPAGK